MKFERSSGIILHPTSLPGKFGIGSLGKNAFEFIDFLSETKQKIWQVLPLGPTGYGDSPYQCFSAFAGNPLLIDLETLVEDGLLTNEDLQSDEIFDDNYVNYGKVIDFKTYILKKAHTNFTKSENKYSKIYDIFCEKNAFWLDDYALFMALKDYFEGRPWNVWPEAFKMRVPKKLEKYKLFFENTINYQKFIQFMFFMQWFKVKNYANSKGIKIVGDIPIFVAFDSADAWANPDIFYFDENRQPSRVAGVPPDYFSKTGQLWGNPLYNWEKLKEEGYEWWLKRISSALNMVDIIRIDHFRGFESYWAVPADADTAINGSWEKAPGQDLFETVEKELGKLPIIAEDLGIITEEVEALRDLFDFPGMKILQFAFESKDETDPYLPTNYDTENCVVYTGTHDNNTSTGWYKEASEDVKDFARRYMSVNGDFISFDMLKTAWNSKALIALAPLQDVFSLGSQTRMNTPGKAAGNWQWRFTADLLEKKQKTWLKEITIDARR